MTLPTLADLDADPRKSSDSLGSPARLGERIPRGGNPHGVAIIGTAIARYGVAIVLLMIGLLKFTASEATAIGALVTSSPLLHWMYGIWSIQGTSNVIGAIEIAAAVGIVLHPISMRAAVVGSALAVGTFLVTLSFFLTAPGVWDAALGFPFLGGTGQFLVKDVVLLGSSLWSLGDALGNWKRPAVHGA